MTKYILPHSGLYTDMYELTMAQGYFLNGRKDVRASFDYFYRKCPFDGGFVILAGLADLLDMLTGLQFDEEDIDYLGSQGFRKEFLDYLKDFRFRGTIYATREGEVVFPNEPVIRVDGNIIEAQIVETLLLNLINFESLIATKTARICKAAGERIVIDFGLRRAHGLGGIHASRAAVIGGAQKTSNVLSAFHYGLDPSGTQAHSWIQSYDDELQAFREFAQSFPDECILLVDTYDTLKVGLPNAIRVAKELEESGHRLVGIRLDSGDLAYLAKKARQMLDDEGLDYVKIAASNQLDEYVIRSLLEQKAPIDVFGVGTRLITGQPDAALDGVYKLCMAGSAPRMKMSENVEKQTLPGKKKVVRYSDDDGQFVADGILLESEHHTGEIFHPLEPRKRLDVKTLSADPLLHLAMENGEPRIENEPPEIIARYAKGRLAHLPEEHERFENPHVYKVGISSELMKLRDQLVEEIWNRYASSHG